MQSWCCALFLLLASSLGYGSDFGEWQKEAAEASDQRARMEALDRIAAAGPEIASPTDIAKALGAELHNDQPDVSRHAARLLGTAEDQVRAFRELDKALERRLRKFFKAQRALRRLEDERRALVEEWYARVQDPSTRPLEEMAARLEVLTASVDYLIRYVAPLSSRDDERAFLVEACAALAKLDRERRKAERAVIRCYDKVVRVGIDQSRFLVPAVLSWGSAKAVERVVEAIVAHEDEALEWSRRYEMSREFVESLERKKDAKQLPFDDEEQGNGKWAEETHNALVEFAAMRSLPTPPPWSSEVFEELEEWLESVEDQLQGE